MYRDFLKKNRLFKLELYQQIGLTNKFEVPTFYLETKFNADYSTISRRVKELNEDIHTITGEYLIELDLRATRLKVANYETFEKIRQQLIAYYLSFSGAYSLCQLICNGKRRVTIQQAGQQLHMSIAHIYRVLKEINAIAAKYHVEIKKDEQNLLRLFGDELRVRVFFYVFVSQNISINKREVVENSSLLNQVPFFNQRKEVMSEINVYKLEILLAVFKNRMVNKCYFDLMEGEALFSVDNEIVIQFDRFFEGSLLFDKQLQKNEVAYFILFIYFFVPEFFDDELLATNYHKFEINDANKATSQLAVQEWQRYLELELNLTEQKRYRLYSYLLYIISYRLQLSAFEFEPFSQYFAHEVILNSPIRQDLEKIAATSLMANPHPQMSPADELWKINFSCLFYLPTQKFLEKVINVGLCFKFQPNEEQFIMQKLRYIYGDSLYISHDIENADIIISDSYLLDSDKPIIFVEDIFNRQNFMLILTRINEEIIGQFY
ncbi:helix-turn-helix domain-containing protein [Vagococcus zengguangii]|uniref:Uncharacterized protein n=1 Tax=Vagococcus zengguangii TaxID=2571750 RepID=A0A4D7CPD0_9ENTE|nr:helix-turn-helix domain-containing protein [Vagococcus zengguangii]QCI85928.1 hypothetical protein FA707_02665 [Vagococcus zengguangii]TLG78322.1 hypothetical protein FE258_09480 [Vagococcus zengguangii]